MINQSKKTKPFLAFQASFIGFLVWAFTNQPKKIQPWRGNISGIAWKVAGTELLGYKRS